MYLLKYKLYTKKNLARDLLQNVFHYIKKNIFAIDLLQVFLTIKREIKSQ